MSLLDDIKVAYRLVKAERMNLVQVVADEASGQEGEEEPQPDAKGKEKVERKRTLDYDDEEDEEAKQKIIFTCTIHDVPYLSPNETTKKLVEAVKNYFS